MPLNEDTHFGRGATALVGTLVAGSIGLTAGVTLALLAVSAILL